MMKTMPILILFLLALTCASQVQAHAVVTQSSLNVNSVLPGQISQVDLTFNSKVELSLSQVFLVSAGDKKQILNFKPGVKPGQVIITVPALSYGEYALQLKIFAADGHLSEDLLRFIVTEEKQ